MASYRAVNGVLLALESFFKARLPADLSSPPVNARIELLGSSDIRNHLSGNLLGIYVHRITIDPHGRSRFFPPTGTEDNRAPAAELPVNLHLLLIAAAASATIESNLMAWAMVTLANEGRLDISHLADADPDWTSRESLTITPEEMPTEDLMRIWDAFQTPYTSCVPYIVQTIRLRLSRSHAEGPEVRSRIFPTGIADSQESNT